MIAAYEDLTPAALAPLGFDDPVQACRHLQEMAGHDIPDTLFNSVLQAVTDALSQCADPDRAAANLGRWADAVGNRTAAYQLLAATPLAAHIVVAVLAASQYFSDLLIRNPEYVEALLNPNLRKRPRDPQMLWSDLERRVGIVKTPNARRDALRRFKGPEMLRIGVRDLLGDADMPTTVREISDFADACVRMALQICRDEQPETPASFAVIAMGKLGGQELNYSSDIDLIFVHGDEEDSLRCLKLAEAVRDTLAKTTDAGYVFRVDLRLRPEGRFGPVSRSLSSCRAYYESWAEPWERQALLKARPIAGDGSLGQSFLTMTQEFVYQSRVDETFVESIRQNKRRLEQKIANAGESDINVKEGIGGIRDIEFSAQLLQLLFGGVNPAVRTGNTLEALERLAASKHITQAESAVLREGYLFLRTVEHRLQLLDDRAVRLIPRSTGGLNKLGRGLGYANGAEFLEEYRAHTGRVHPLFERLFYQQAPSDSAIRETHEISQWVLAPNDPNAQESLHKTLLALHYAHPGAALALLQRAVTGSEYGGIPPDERSAFAVLSGPLVVAAAGTDAPDAALRGLCALADAAATPTALYQTLLESPTLLARLAHLAADAGHLWQTLLTHLEFLDLLADEEAMDSPLPAQNLLTTRSTLARNALRFALHTGARDIWGLADVEETGAALTRLAEDSLSGALAIARRETGFAGSIAIIGLGKLGGSELGYGSDWDVLYIGAPGELTKAIHVIERVQHLLHNELARDGVQFKVDARLRPEGRNGSLALDLESYHEYYTRRAATWERQALLKARPVAGDIGLGIGFSRLVDAVVYGRGVSDEELTEIRAMKRRIETERAKTDRDLKLGPGGLADIEWTVQLLQLRNGQKRLRLRQPGTLAALRALRDDALITQIDWDVLDSTYRLLTRLRNGLYLQRGISTDTPPVLPDAVRVAMLRARTVCRQRFYQESDTDEK